MKNNKGAISIEMIVTVIVIIVLVGIAIFMLTGENGVFVPNNQENTVTTNEVKEQNAVNTNEVQDAQGENTALTVPVE